MLHRRGRGSEQVVADLGPQRGQVEVRVPPQPAMTCSLSPSRPRFGSRELAGGRFGVAGARTALSAVLGILSVFASIGGVRRWYRVQQAMRRGEPLPRSPLVVVQAAGLALVAAAVVTLVLLR